MLFCSYLISNNRLIVTVVSIVTKLFGDIKLL